MKVLHVLYSGLGGHGNVFYSMVDADEQHVFEYEALFFGIEDVRHNYVEKAAAKNIPWHFVKKKPGIDLASYRQIVSIIKKAAPEIIFIHTSAYIFPAKWASLFSRKKMKVIVRETQPNHLKTKFEWLGLCVALLAAHKVVFLSTEYRDEIKKKLQLLFSGKRTAVIPNGINLSLFRPFSQLKDENFVHIGMQSRLSVTKDHSTLLEAFAILMAAENSGKKLQLNIAGDGECRPALEALAAKLNISGRVVFSGMLEEKDLPAFINNQDIYVHASLGETMSTAIMQVMACKKPVVASDVDGINNMVKDGINGLLVKPKQPQLLANAIAKLIADKNMRHSLAENAYTNALEKFSNKKMFESYKAIFTK